MRFKIWMNISPHIHQPRHTRFLQSRRDSIRNETRATIRMMYKWGNGSWHTVTLVPGQRPEIEGEIGEYPVFTTR